MQTFDLIISLGHNCDVSGLLKLEGFRENSFPFDYGISDLEIITNLIDKNFNKFFNFQKCTEIHKFNHADGPNTIFRNISYPNLGYPHHNFNDPVIVKTFKRRIRRLQTVLSSNYNILFIHLHNKPIDSQIDNFFAVMKKKYPKCKYRLITIYSNIRDLYGLERMDSRSPLHDAYKLFAPVANLDDTVNRRHFRFILRQFTIQLQRVN